MVLRSFSSASGPVTAIAQVLFAGADLSQVIPSSESSSAARSCAASAFFQTSLSASL